MAADVRVGGLPKEVIDQQKECLSNLKREAQTDIESKDANTKPNLEKDSNGKGTEALKKSNIIIIFT